MVGGCGATLQYVLHFIRDDMSMLVAVGSFFQYLKEKSGTIWIPVLRHALWDMILP